ncbi:MAG: RNA polymerase subunit sigma-70 [Actinobacteria bacterium]|nr:RNA polymerase subunit sigma-70 [Actinomycetota bacterium]
MTEGGAGEFEAATAPYRRELIAHCYRMTGSVQEAEDVVQDAYLRAWRAFGRFEQRSSVRAWLYRITTNTCLTALQRRARRPLPSGLGPPSRDPLAPARPERSGVRWLEPVPDRLVIDELGDPAEVVAARASVRLALVAAMQLLSPRQRAAFLLCEVLALTPAAAAEVLGVSVAALKSLLQRARARLATVPLRDEDLAEPADPAARQVLDRYLAAFANSDMAALEALLADDATLEMTGTTTWFSGRATCVPYLRAFAIGSPGMWKMAGLPVNGQLGAASYCRGEDGRYHPFAIVVLATTATHLKRITLFADPALFTRFGLPAAR